MLLAQHVNRGLATLYDSLWRPRGLENESYPQERRLGCFRINTISQSVALMMALLVRPGF